MHVQSVLLVNMLMRMGTVYPVLLTATALKSQPFASVMMATTELQLMTLVESAHVSQGKDCTKQKEKKGLTEILSY